MQPSTPISKPVDTEKSVFKPDPNTQSLLAWIPYSMVSNQDVRENIDHIIYQYIRNNKHTDPAYLHKTGKTWQAGISKQYLTSPTGTLILTANEKDIDIIPIRYSCSRPEIHDQKNGWEKLIQSIQHEPKYSVIQLSFEFAELYEVKRGKSSLLIRQPINRQHRVSNIQEFAYAVRQICSNGLCPLIVRCSDHGIHELDTITIAKINPIQQYMVNRNNRSIVEWGREIDKCGLSDEWIQAWQESRIKKAMKGNRWIVNAQEIKTNLLQNRIAMFVKNEREPNLFKNIPECYSLLFKNNVHILRSDQKISGAILK